MTSNIQTIHDAVVALITTVGIAVALSIVMMAVGTYLQRGKARVKRIAYAASGPAQHPTSTDKTRELVLH